MEKELNREQIIKALECLNDKHDRICDECPVYKLTDRGYRSCRHVVLEEAVALIKELIAENESLSQSLANSKLILANSKADTVRKMQERLKAEKFVHKNFGELVYVENIDQIAKEVLEGKQ